MQLTERQILKFQNIYQSRFGVSIPYEEAQQIGLNLVTLVQKVYRPIKKNDNDKVTQSTPA